jgi:hypothetical protein
MGMTSVTWEDEENNRQVEFSLAYAIENQEVTIREITPKAVAFLSAQQVAPVRSIGVHTQAGRQMLARQFKKSRQYANLTKQIASQNCALTA